MASPGCGLCGSIPLVKKDGFSVTGILPNLEASAEYPVDFCTTVAELQRATMESEKTKLYRVVMVARAWLGNQRWAKVLLAAFLH